MSLKDLISTLIEAVFGSKKAFISNQAMPNVASHITLANNVGNETEFVAPSNGYVCLQGQSNAVNNELSLVSNELRSSSWGVNGWGVRIFLPIGKGQSFKAASNGFAFNALTFISSIGGGLSSIIQSGGAVCLRLKTILYQSAILLTKDLFHQTNLSTFSLRKQAKLMSRPLMAMLSVLPQIPLMLKQSILVTGNLLHRLFLATLRHGAVFGSRVKKGILLQLISRVLADRHFDLYSLGMVQANLRSQGGAL